MYISINKNTIKEISVRNRSIEAVLFEEGNRLTRLLLPPVNDGDSYEIRRDVVVRDQDGFIESSIAAYKKELKQLLKKLDEFSNSPAYLSKISWLSNICGHSDSALNFSRCACELTDNPVFLYKYVEQLLISGKNGEAIELLKSDALKNYPQASRKLSEIYVMEDNYEKAKECINKSVDIEPFDWSSQFVAGTLCLREKKPEMAIRHFRIALESKSNSSTLYTNYGIAFYITGQVRKATRELRKALYFNPLNKNALTIFSDLMLLEEKSMDEVERYLRRYLSLSGQSKTILERLISVYSINNKYNQMIDALSEAEIYASDDPGYWNNFGYAYANKAGHNNPSSYFIKAIELTGGLSEIHTDRGAELAALNLSIILLEKKKFKGAYDFIGQCFETVPDDRYLTDDVLHRFTSNYITSLFKIGKVEKAVSYSEKIISEQRANPLLIIDNSQLLSTFYLLNSGEKNRALDLAKKTYKFMRDEGIEDEHVIAMTLNNLMFAALENNNIELAKEHINALRKYKVDGGCYAYATMGLYEIRTGNYEEGEKLYHEAAGMAGSHELEKILKQKLYLELGKYWLNKDKKRAFVYLKKASKLKLCGTLFKSPILLGEANELLKTLKSN